MGLSGASTHQFTNELMSDVLITGCPSSLILL